MAFDFPNTPSDGQQYKPAGGPTYVWNAADGAWRALGTSTPVEVRIVETVYTSSSTWTKQPGLSYLEAKVQAAGGAGGGVQATSASQYACSSGGGGGGYITCLFDAASLPASVAITVGAAGAGASGAAGGAGGSSIFAIGGGLTLTANGGGGGAIAITTAPAYTISAVATGGAVSGPTGAHGVIGGYGGYGAALYAPNGGYNMAGSGGNSFLSTGFPLIPVTTSSGASAYPWGGGGGGQASLPSVAVQTGKPGTGGIVIIREYYFSIAAVQPTYVPTAQPQNLIVNGAIQHSQENGFQNTFTVAGTYIADQWYMSYTGPTGGTHLSFRSQPTTSLLVGQISIGGTSTPYTTVAAGNLVQFLQPIEGNVLAPLGLGISSAIPAVLDFEVWCSVTGTFACSLRSSNQDYSIVFPITITQTGVYQRFTFAIPPLTAGTWPRDNTVGGYLSIAPLVGSTFLTSTTGAWLSGTYCGVTGMSNILATANQYFYIRKVALYPDPNNTGRAPDFRVPDYATELVRCQRYWQYQTGPSAGVNIIHGIATAASQAIYGHVTYPVVMRAAPTLASVPAYGNCNSFQTGVISNNGFRCNATTAAAGSAYVVFTWTATARM